MCVAYVRALVSPCPFFACQPNLPEHFAGTDATGRKVEFHTHFHKDMNKPKSWRSQSKRRHTPVAPDEASNPRWFRKLASGGGAAAAAASKK